MVKTRNLVLLAMIVASISFASVFGQMPVTNPQGNQTISQQGTNQNGAGTVISVSTDKPSYSFGDTIMVSGVVSSVTAGTPLTIQILDSNGNLVQVHQVDVSQNGMYADSMLITGTAWKSIGIYTIQVQYGPPNITAQTTFNFILGSSVSSGSSEIDIAKGAGGSAQASCVSTNNCFTPNPLTVALGTTVTWKNTDTAMHVICSGKVTDPECGKVFEFDSLKPGSTFQFTFTNPGAYDYYCSIHPWMTGQVIVGASSTLNTTTPSQTSITATTDKSSYTAGDEIVVSGSVNPPSQVNPEQPIVIKTYDPNNELVRMDQTVPSSLGTYSLTMPVHGPLWKNAGTYTLKVQYDVNTHSTLTIFFNPGTTQTQSQQIQMTSGGMLNVGFSTDPVNPSVGSQTQLKINFINKQTSTLQPHVDYKVSVTQGGNQVFGIPVTHVGADPANSQGLPVTIPIQFTNGGNYVVTVELDGVLFQPIPPQTATFDLNVSGPQTTAITPTSSNQNINHAQYNQTVAAEVNIGPGKTETNSIDNNVSVKTTQSTPDSLNVQVSATNQTGPKVIAFNLEAKSINVENLKDLGVMYDGKLISPAPNMDAILHAKPTDNPSFAIIVTQSGVQVLVLIPHFSTHTITITNMTQVIPAIPEFGPVAGLVIMLSMVVCLVASRRFCNVC